MPSRQLYLHIRDLLHVLHEDSRELGARDAGVNGHGADSGRNVQFWELAVWIPADIQLLSFEPGTPPIVNVIAFAVAMRLIQRFGKDAFRDVSRREADGG